MSGRPRKPTALKIVQGTARPDRLLTNEPTPPVAVGAKPPYWLDKMAREFWKRNAPGLLTTGVLTEADVEEFATLCNCWSVYRAAVKTYRAAASYEQSTAALALHRVTAELRGLLADFGMNPVGRSRISAAPRKQADPFEEFLGDSRKNG